MNAASEIWEKVLDILRGQLTTTAINTWFNDTEAIEIRDGTLFIYCPSEFKQNVIENRFRVPITEALFDIFSGEFNFVLLNEKAPPKIQNNAADKQHTFINNTYFTFERFVVGGSNKFAHAAAIAVAENPATVYNPLFIYGESGLGKTHLLHAICHAILKSNPHFQITYVKGDDFANGLIAAIQAGTTADFRKKYRTADLFLVDDIQFIAGKVQTQEEFFHTFNTLYEANCQIVMTSDRAPIEIIRLEDRLKSRFEWGLLADIQPPNYETRMAIIKNKSNELGLILPDDVANYIAENITTNIRQLEGIVKKLTAYQSLLSHNPDLTSVTRAIKDMIKEQSEYLPSPERIIQETAYYYSLTADDLKGTGKTRNTAEARQISMYLIRKLTGLSLVDIGKEYYGRSGKGMDHTSVMSGIRKVEEKLKASLDFNDTLRDITANINAKSQ